MVITPTSPRVFLALLAALCTLAIAAAPAPQIARANGLIQRAETNLASVAPSLNGRTSPPGGAAARVLANRLSQALGDLNQAKELIEQVPADSEGRAEVAARYGAAVAEYNRLNAIMTGGAAAPPAQADDGTPLNYQQREQLSGANFNIREVQANAEQVTTRVGALRSIEDQLSINHREISQLRSVVENAQRKSGFAAAALDKLPAGGQGVAQARQSLTDADARIAAAAEYLDHLHAKLQELIDPANYPGFDADAARLRELSAMFARPEILRAERPLAAETYAQAAAAKAEHDRLTSRYARLIAQQTEQGTRIEGIAGGFLKNHAAFVAQATAERNALPEQIRADLATARKNADDAVQSQKPLWFTGGIPQVMGFAAEKIDLLAAIDPTAAAPLRAEFAQTQQQLTKQAESLRELIIRENQMPEDRFTGPDRDQAIKTAISGWTVQQKDFELLKARIPADAWARETKWTYSNGTWYFSDRSKLQVRLLIADPSNKDLAIDRAINVWKDHQKGDTMIGVPLWGIDDEPQPHHYLLRAKVR